MYTSSIFTAFFVHVLRTIVSNIFHLKIQFCPKLSPLGDTQLLKIF